MEGAQAVLQQDELHHVVDLLEVELSQHHVDRVGGGEDHSQKDHTEKVTPGN